MIPLRNILMLALVLTALLSLRLAVFAEDGTNAEPKEIARQRNTVSEVIFPTQSVPLHFSHKVHVEKVGAVCSVCHTGISASASSLDNNLPGEAECRTCHAIDRKVFEPKEQTLASGRCDRCHVGFDAAKGPSSVKRSVVPIPNLKFSHKAHLARNRDCAGCHGNIVDSKANVRALPKMRVCLTCHDGVKAPDKCATCHLSAPGGVIHTNFAESGLLRPSGVMRGAGHGMGFLESHKYAAQNEPQLCASCHTKDYCLDCHNGVTKPMSFHIGDYITMHPIEARRNSSDCSSCHRIQTFCQGCHSRSGVAGDGRSPNLLDGIQYHPPGFTNVGLTGRGVNHHSYRAQRNIKECASCHRESFCTKCHSNQIGAPKINPHPRNWRGSRRCNALLKRSRRMCLRCHTETTPVTCL